MKRERTERGFAYNEFYDDYGAKCSLQKSSSVVDKIWLGINNAEPKILASDAASHGVKTNKTQSYEKNFR